MAPHPRGHRPEEFGLRPQCLWVPKTRATGQMAWTRVRVPGGQVLVCPEMG
jgi:hypothetical protein